MLFDPRMEIRIPPSKVSEVRRLLELVEASPKPMGLVLSNEEPFNHFERKYREVKKD